MSIELIGSKELWQWEQGRKVSVSVECDQISFSYEHDNDAIIGVIEEEVGCRSAEIPNLLLMKDKKIRVWAEKDGAVIAHKMFTVKRRPMPSTYVYVPTQVVTIESIKEDLRTELMAYVDERVEEVVDEKLEEVAIEVEVETMSDEDILAILEGGEA